MPVVSSIAVAAALIFISFFTPASAHGRFKVLYTFCKDGGDCLDGAGPSGGLVEDAEGNLYGATGHGGSTSNCSQFCGYGVVFELKRTTSGYKYRILRNFGVGVNDAADPGESLILDTAGNLYGVSEGGTHSGGTVFELLRTKGKSPWPINILYNFCSETNCADGGGPSSGLTFAGAASGALYDGTSPLFGVTFGLGGLGGQAPSVAYELQPGKSFQVLHTFDGVGGDGAGALGPVVLDTSGNLYGSTIQGGNRDEYGVVYEISHEGSETVLHAFCESLTFPCTDGDTPESGLVIDPLGNVYGTTYYGGINCPVDGGIGCGLAFKLKPSGVDSKETVLHTFCASKHCADGVNPFGSLLLDSQGDIFGTALLGGNKVPPYGHGVIFQLSGSRLQVLHEFCQQASCTDGNQPSGALIRDAKGRLFGTTFGGGTDDAGSYPGNGIVYELVP